MAKKKDLKIDSSDVDMSLDFDEFNFDDIDALSSDDTKSKKRNPVNSAFKGAIKGLKSKSKDTIFLQQLLKESLPNEYGSFIDVSDEVAGNIGSLYNEATKEIKPVAEKAAKFVDRLIPAQYKRTHAIFNRLKKKLESTEYKSSASSPERQREEGLEQTIRSVFEIQAQADAETEASRKAESLLKTKLESDRYISEHQLLNTIATSVSSLHSYNERINAAYQKKSLELQYRSYFVQADFLNAVKAQHETLRIQNEAIIKNTALPEYVKITQAEKFKDLARTKFFDTAREGLFGQGNFLKEGFSNLRKTLLSQIGVIKDAFEQGITIGEDALEAQETARDSGIDVDNVEEAGNLAGEWAGSKIARKAGSKIKKRLSRKGSKFEKFGHRLSQYSNNLPGAISDLKKSDFLRERHNTEDDYGRLGGIKNILRSITSAGLSSFSNNKIDMDLNTGNGIFGLSGATIGYDQASRKSLVTVIPGYLSRILREIQVFRTGDERQELTVFDSTKDTFLQRSHSIKSTSDYLKSQLDKGDFSKRIDLLSSNIRGDATLSKGAAETFKKQLSRMVHSQTLYNKDTLLKPEFYKDIDPIEAEEIRAMIQSQLHDADRGETHLEEKNNIISQIANNARHSVKDIRGDIQAFVNAGYSDQLVELGLISLKKEGGYSINYEKYKTFLLDDSNDSSGSSDDNGPGNRPGRPPKGRRRSPSNRITRRNRIAPPSPSNNSSIDPCECIELHVANPLLAIQESNQSILDLLQGWKIDNNESRKKKNKKSRNRLNSEERIVQRTESIISETDSLFENASENNLSDQRQDADTSRAGSSNKISNLARDIYNNSSDLLGWAFSRGSETIKDVISNQLPKGSQQLFKILSYGRDKLTHAAKRPYDVYIKGQASPLLQAALFKAGAYFDQLTGKVILSPDEIRGAVINAAGEVLLTTEQFLRGIYNQFGKKIKTRFLAGKNLIGQIGGNILSYGSDYLSSGKQRLSNAAQGGFSILSGLWKKLTTSRNNQPESAGRPGSWQSKLEDSKKRDEARRAEKKGQNSESGMRYRSGTNILDTIIEKAGGAYDTISEGLSSLKDMMDSASEASGGNEGNQGGNREQNPRRRRGRGQRQSGRTPARSRLGRLAQGAERAGRNIAGNAGVARGASAIARGGLAIGGRALVGGIAEAALGATGAGIALEAIGGTAAAAATAAMSFISWPVVLGVGAVALAGYGSYLLYKRFTRNKASLIDVARFTQYGFSSNESEDYYRLFALEDYLQDGKIIYNNKVAFLNDSKIIPDELFSIFDVLPDNLDHKKRFLTWFAKRFKAVFLTHLTALYVINKKTKLEEANNLEDKEKRSYLNACKFSDGPYQYTECPLEKKLILTIKKSDVEAAYAAALADLKDSKIKKAVEPGSISATVASNADKKEQEVPGGAAMLKKLETWGKTELTTIATSTYDNLKTTGLSFISAVKEDTKLLLSISSRAIKRFGLSVSALEAVRFKSYGLVYLDRIKVSAIRRLEECLASKIRVTRDGVATFDGDAAIIIKEVGGEFSLSSINDKNAAQWLMWFKFRFLPIYLTYTGIGYLKTNKLDSFDIEESLKEGDQYEIGLKISGVSDVWTIGASPWIGIVLGTNSAIIKDNMAYLQIRASKEKLTEQSVSQKKAEASIAATTAANPTPGASASGTSTFVTPQPNTFGPRITAANSQTEISPTNNEVPTGKTSTLAGTIAGGIRPEPGAIAPNAPMQTPNSVSITNAPVDSKFGDAFIQPIGHAIGKIGVDSGGPKRTGMMPGFMRNFRAMAAEYGKKTKKKIVITSAFRTYEDQVRAKKNSPRLAATPGYSAHEFGLAMDISSANANELESLGLMKKYGFTRPIGAEDWHIEPSGVAASLQSVAKSKLDSKYAEQQIAASLGRGGGGYGLTPGARPKGRDDKTSGAVFSGGAAGVMPTSEELGVVPGGDVNMASGSGAIPKPGMSGIETQGGTTPSSQGGIAQGVQNAGPATIGGQAESANAASSAGGIDRGMQINAAQSQAPQPSSPIDTSGKQSNIKKIIVDAAQRVGVDPAIALTMAAVESGMGQNKAAKSSSARGIFQFIKGTWAKVLKDYGGKYNLSPNTSPMDDNANALMGMEFIKENARALSGVRPNPGAGDLYLAHFMGAGGAKKLFSLPPGEIAAKHFPAAAFANPTIFGNNRTVGGIIQWANDVMQKRAKQWNIPLGASPSTSLPQIAKSQQTNQTTINSAPTPQNGPASPAGQLPEQLGVTPGLGPQPAAAGATGGLQVPTGIETNQAVNVPPQISAPIDRGASLGSLGLNDGIANLDKTLIKSIDIQTQMLTTLQQILTKIEPERLIDIINKLGSSSKNPEPSAVNTTSPAKTAPRGGVDLTRSILA
jgi:hypothetical protein